MKTTFRIFCNHSLRMWNRRNVIVITLIMTLASMALAIYFTAQSELKGTLAVVTRQKVSLTLSSEQYRIQYLQQPPPKSELVRNRYDAVVTFNSDGSHRIESLKSDEFKQQLEHAIVRPHAPLSVMPQRGIGTNILGYLTMFLLIQALFYLQLFSDDKKTGTFRRTAVSPAGIVPYLSAQCLFGFMAVYVPTWLVLALAKAVGINIGFGLGTYSLLLVLPALLAVSFALFMAAWIENADNGLSLSSAIILLSSVLSGSFYTIAHQNGIMKVITSVFPQQHFITLVQEMELKGEVGLYWEHALYVIVASAVLAAAGWLICKNRFRKGFYG
ncbi:ABC transporter permease [Paenibacillus polymyxa]|uniref:ABC transporter permease n=1 Tax=Paenibacillus polymyxa TaxID=1406 RepID=UPI000470777F|nr:ABC transporter permease [Paenibacillus polymyxa]